MPFSCSAVTLAVTGRRRDAESAALARLEETPLLLPPCCRGAVNSVAVVAAIGQDHRNFWQQRNCGAVFSRQQLEGDLVSRADDAEVAAVERRHFGGDEPLGSGDHRSVDGAER